MKTPKKYFYVFLEWCLSFFCDAIICISDAEKESALSKRICNKSKLHTIYNGIDLNLLKNIHPTKNIPEDVFVVGMVGRICRQKSPDIFVKMASHISKKIKNAYFVIVGDVLESNEKEKDELVKLARSLSVNIHITGWLDNPYEYIMRFNVACLFSRWEGFGLVIPEYMLCRVPVIATNVDGIKNLITNKYDGFLVEQNDWKSAGDFIVKLESDLLLRQKLINNAYDTVRSRFDAKRVIMETEKLYQDLVYEKN